MEIHTVGNVFLFPLGGGYEWLCMAMGLLTHMAWLTPYCVCLLVDLVVSDFMASKLHVRNS